MPKEYKWIDPKLIPENDDLIVVLVDDRYGMMGWFIKWWTVPKDHTSGSYNHAMMMRKAGFVVSQGGTFSEFPIDAYMKTGNFLKFWRIKNLTPEERKLIVGAVDKKLSQPWYKKSYDVVGLFGQAAPWLNWMQVPWLNFCSEAIAAFLRFTTRFKWVTKEPSPTLLNSLFNQHPDDFEVIGYWYSD